MRSSAAIRHTSGDPGRAAAGLLVRELAVHHPYTARHCANVARLADLLAFELNLAAADRVALQRSALLHDIGKLAVPVELLDGEAPALTDAQQATLRAHSAEGEARLACRPQLAEHASVVRGVHERWDGSGYPDGLAGEAIPFASRVIAVCDAFDAMTSPERRYQSPKTPAQALFCLMENAGSQFDPRVVARFVSVIEKSPAAATRPNVAAPATRLAA